MEFPEAQFKSKALLLNALHQLGWTPEQIEVHGTPANLVGFQGDTRADTADIIIRRKFIGSLSNDLGFRYVNGAYVPIVSEYDNRYLRRRAGMEHGFVPTLRHAYNQEVASEITRRLRGRQVTQQRGSTRQTVVSY